MNRTIEAKIEIKADRALTEQELKAVTGGKIMPPNNSTKLPYPPVVLSPKL